MCYYYLATQYFSCNNTLTISWPHVIISWPHINYLVAMNKLSHGNALLSCGHAYIFLFFCQWMSSACLKLDQFKYFPIRNQNNIQKYLLLYFNPVGCFS